MEPHSGAAESDPPAISPPTTSATLPTSQVEKSLTETVVKSKLGTVKDQATGEASNTPSYLRSARHRSASGNSRSTNSDIQPDSSDVESSEYELEEGEFSRHEMDFEVVGNKKKTSGVKGNRGRGPKLH